MEIEKRVKA